MVAPVVTGTTGAWGKVDSIKSVSLSPIPASSVSAETYKLTISYKVHFCDSRMPFVCTAIPDGPVISLYTIISHRAAAGTPPPTK